MINANNNWEIIEGAYQNLQDEMNLPTDRSAPADEIKDWELGRAIDETTYQIAGTHLPELALLRAFAQEGYLDNDEIWEAIGDAIARGLLAYADERRQDFEDSLEEPDEYWA